MRRESTKQWIKSFYEETGKDARLYQRRKA